MSAAEPTEEKVYPFYKKRVENVFTVIALILCTLSFMYGKSVTLLIVFLVFTVICIAYYIFWQKKGPIYIRINKKEITVFRGLLFEPVSFQRSSILSIQSNPIFYRMILSENRKKVFIFPLLLADNDKRSLKENLMKDKKNK